MSCSSRALAREHYLITARGVGKANRGGLDKIENSERQAVAETRRMLGLLRDADEETGRCTPRCGQADRAR